jgi:hypothetical protein
MNRTFASVTFGIILFLVGCAGGDVDSPVTVSGSPAKDPIDGATASVTVEGTGTPAADVSASADDDARVPDAAGGVLVAELADAFPAAASEVAAASWRVGVAVLPPSGTTIYVGGDEGTFALASVSKLPIMLATFERARLESRELTANERELLSVMIRSSNNAAASALWSAAGGAAGVGDLLSALGVEGVDLPPDDQWGDARASATAVALMLNLLIDERSSILPEHRRMGLALMESVVADQRWGSSAGLDYSSGSGAVLAIKNGWYPDVAGWRLNSAAVISVEEGERSAQHVVVVLSEGAATQTAGVRTIEAIAAAANHELAPAALVVELAPWTPDPAGTSTGNDGSGTDEGGVEDEAPEVSEEAEGTATAEPPPAFVAVIPGSDLLVPSEGRLMASETDGAQLTLWFEVEEDLALLDAYTASMRAVGWSVVAGPPSVVLSKSGEGRYVGLSTHPSGTTGQILRVSISPIPGNVLAAAASASPD